MHPAARFLVGLLLYLLIAGTVSNFGQSLGDIARQERERRASEPSHSKHVYTNEDLLRPKILQPQEPSRVEPSGRVPRDESVIAGKPVSEPARTASTNEIQDSPKVQLPARQEIRKKVRAHVHFASTARPLPVSAPLSIRPKTHFHKVSRSAKVQMARKRRVRHSSPRLKPAPTYMNASVKLQKVSLVSAPAAAPKAISSKQIKMDLPRSHASDTQSKALHVRVRKGDSLWNVAHVRLGSGRAWKCIAIANPQIPVVDVIYPGQVLTIPAGCLKARNNREIPSRASNPSLISLLLDFLSSVWSA